VRIGGGRVVRWLLRGEFRLERRDPVIPIGGRQRLPFVRCLVGSQGAGGDESAHEDQDRHGGPDPEHHDEEIDHTCPSAASDTS